MTLRLALIESYAFLFKNVQQFSILSYKVWVSSPHLQNIDDFQSKLEALYKKKKKISFIRASLDS